ncbi:hypothetical protein AF6_1526 [Anoxybacillus flavithermus TNO-09.006]|uniref:hypothetical protein n=1 Tax=Anoxybacillus flavithermus TaxID=33934 RepID=UPI0002A72210|nr:hypothetical protein [Anoxybacillus flavithermus]ELK21787.1 hypothetical protein AF6_1526 [Anoxybacillus flavithermus TNO-09.006]
MNRLAHHQGIHKFLTMLGLALYFSKPVMKHLVHIVDAMITKGFSGTLTDLHHGSFHPNHRTTLSHFFHEKPMGGRDAASQTPTVGASSCRTQLETRESTHFCFDR